MVNEDQRTHFRRVLAERMQEIKGTQNVTKGANQTMDPNATLVLIRTLVSSLLTDMDAYPEDQAETGLELAQAVDNLDKWVTSGGFLPTVWNASHPPF